MKINTVGVVGAGTMGLGIAQISASAGFDTTLYDVNAQQSAAALVAIRRNLSDAVSKGRMTPAQETETLSHIKVADGLADVKCDLVIEAVVEKLEVKHELFRSLEQLNRPGTILASNTSSISITEIASCLEVPSRCVGLHFFNPADRMKLVEIISGRQTDPSLAVVLGQFCERIGKIAVLAKDSPGFIVNRVARPYYLESLRIVEDSIAEVPSIDRLLRSAGFKMGPFELMDLIGVDVNLEVTKSVYEGFGKSRRFRPSEIQESLVGKGNYGRKTGKGFYDYASKQSR